MQLTRFLKILIILVILYVIEPYLEISVNIFTK
jgi:hypothetical protein